MNRSFRSSQESQMKMAAAAVKQRQQLRASMMKEKEEELALFLEMKKREKEQQNHLLLFNNTEDDFDAPLGSKPGTSPIFNISSTTTPARKVSGADDFLNSENDKNDYEWLLTPPGTPLFPSLEMESQKSVMSQIGTPKARPTALKSRLANPQPEPATRGSLASKQSASSPGLNSSGAGTRRPSSSGGPGSRPATPTGRPTLTSTAKPSRSSTPTSRATLPSPKSSVSATKPTISATKPTPAMKPTSSATKPAVPARSSTPTRSTARSSTPTARPSIPPSKSTSRASTPTRRPSTPASAPLVSAPPIKSSPSVTRTALTTARNPVPSRGTSPTIKSRPWKPSEMPGFSLDAPPNLRTSLPERPLSATRGRPGAPSSRSSSVEPTPNGRPRRQSCSPARGRAPNGIMHPSGSSVPAISRLHAKANDNVSPVLIGTKMVERVINMRKLAPPKQDDKLSPHGNLSGKSSSPDSSGFGRTLSKKSLDMAIRHMDIRRSIPGNLRPLMTNIPASSMYSVRSGSARSRTISVSDSPLATSSNGSSEVSVNNNGLCLDAIELEDDIGSERGGRSPL
ncbi:endochitinase A [Ricinus communis]|uniref:ATP binding protein, putative n=1 Tax=Ricinus communis TaxID=3988 RepID=B9SLM8_RICCO|nr:endochitinase A [Ricinus communis]EEF35528.1 ATP binding protein, putative [Ricinus communis]|eukprot:XP_002526897.1 endochitinase A [Ricinus communis]